jgi:hypothetical protein
MARTRMALAMSGEARHGTDWAVVKQSRLFQCLDLRCRVRHGREKTGVEGFHPTNKHKQ